MSAPFVSLCLFLALCLSIGLSVESLKAEDGYETFPAFNQSRYKVEMTFTAFLNWTDAVSFCENDGDGSHLVIINSEAEAEAIRELMATTIDADIRQPFVGITDIVNEGIWVTIKGDLVTESGYNEWKLGYPSGGTDDNCGMTYIDGLYYDRSCASPMPYICEKPNV